MLSKLKIQLLLALLSLLSACAPIPRDVATDPAVEVEQKRLDFDNRVDEHAREMLEAGREIFRYDSFGSEVF